MCICRYQSLVHCQSYSWGLSLLSCSSHKAKDGRRSLSVHLARTQTDLILVLKITCGYLQLVPAISRVCFGRRALSVPAGLEPKHTVSVCHELSKAWQTLGLSAREEHKHSQGSNIPTAKEHGSYKPNLSVLEHHPPCTFSEGGHWRMNVDELHSVHLPGCYKPTAGHRGVCWCSVSTIHSAQVEMCPSERNSLILMYTLVSYSVLPDRGETDLWQLLISLYYVLLLL